ncbi:NAD-dependent succinate-semialdehyde dehydrogenase [Novosphingobium cyanobacteriorum]|uniref:NAD-dependent succinate-semialdehyde dehydrogenase n=1 Tax=Novosphingobium cyanobacteriorum TaxID=3024215 RepID=A0ABT6CJJ7_9SPHN|nr:NAD-dependent succinate-semialdehyde dehydrogenase [Novosphingobium cyanobacteriorum]MDF8333709.1 NAD-dependent succinate-semialdehyde dehydrogenase [Novosphingobium cyanobacteriorum]
MLTETRSADQSPIHHELLRQNAFIAGKWVNGPDRIAVTDPATGKVIGSVPDLGADAALTAVEAAQAALQDWRRVSPLERANVLLRWYDAIIANQQALARLLVAEQGKPLAEAVGEIGYAAAFVRWFAEEARRINGDVLASEESRRLMVLREPVGVVGAVTPWNFPAAMITRKVAPALAAGCTVVLKPSELTPFTALALADLGQTAGIPAGAFNVVTGQPAPIGDVLTSDPRVRKFTFTGSTAVGKMLAARCMDTVKRVSLELGGNAPFLVFDDADVDAAVAGVIASKFRNSGQTCVCANRIYVQRGIKPLFAEKLAVEVARLTPGCGTEPGVTQGPLINDAAVEKVARHVADAVSRGGRVLVGGSRIESAGAFFAPTVIDDVPADALLCREETFGPVAGLVTFDTEEQAVAFANDSSAGLAAYFYTRDHARIVRVQRALEYGIVGANTGLISTETGPFGGIKESGIGREGSRHGMDDYLEFKFVCEGLR